MKNSKYICPYCQKPMAIQYGFMGYEKDKVIDEVFCFNCGIDYNPKTKKIRFLNSSGIYHSHTEGIKVTECEQV